MDPFLGVFLGLLLGVVNVVGQAVNNNRNITAQEKANEKNEALMRESWEKESIVNKAKEYEEAGFSPLLATGVSSNYTPIQVQPTKSNFDISSVLGSVSEGFNQTMLYKQMKQAEDSAKLDNEYKREQINLLKTQIEHYGESPELKNLEYVWGKLEEHWPHVADQISSWMDKFGADRSQLPEATFGEPSSPTSVQIMDDIVDSGYGHYEDGKAKIRFNSTEDARKWFISIGGTTQEWYYLLSKYKTVENMLDNLISTGGWYFAN